MKTVLISSIIFLSLSKSAYAYLNPGTGSVILQFLIAALAAGASAVTIFWRRVKEFFLKTILRRETKTTEQETTKENLNK